MIGLPERVAGVVGYVLSWFIWCFGFGDLLLVLALVGVVVLVYCLVG